MAVIVISPELMSAIVEHDEEALHQGDDIEEQWEYQDMVLYVWAMDDAELDNVWNSDRFWMLIKMGEPIFEEGRAYGFRTADMDPDKPYFHGTFENGENGK